MPYYLIVGWGRGGGRKDDEMTITSKYAGKCRKCGAWLPAGTKIEWSKGSGATCAGGCKSGSKSAAPAKRPSQPSSPSKAGQCVESDGITVLIRRLGFDSGKPDPTRELGRTYRAGKRAGAVAGQLVTVVGCVRSYMSRSDAEDMASYEDAGWTLHEYVRAASEEEAAPALEAERLAAEKKAAAEKVEADKKAAEAASWEALRAHYAGLVCLDGYGHQLIAARGDRIADASTERGLYTVHCSSLTAVTLCDGTSAILESTTKGDDWRDHLWVDAATAERVWAAVRFQKGTTVAEATVYLEKYSGCYGAGYYRWVAAQGEDDAWPGSVEPTSYLPIDVGFDLRLHEDMSCTLPDGDPVSVTYLDRADNPVTLRGTRDSVRMAMEAVGYRVADGLEGEVA
jgi:hypothetical protein